MSHAPVLLAEVLGGLAPADGKLFVDGTFGRGGYTEALLRRSACRVVAIDQDAEAIAAGAELAKSYGARLQLIQGRFGSMVELLAGIGVSSVSGITLDLGVSSPQLDQPGRGFSFRFDGPLDMRMGQVGPTAADVVNTTEEADLASIIYRLGEERYARPIARAIVAARQARPIERTLELAEIVRSVVLKSGDKIDPATRTFQALRLHVNDEMGELDRGLAAAERLLEPGGRLAVVSFHSLEDRPVKNFLRARSAEHAGYSRHLPAAPARRAATFRLVGRNPVKPSTTELAANPRSRSARLRVAERTDAVIGGAL
jgi:16S rRNA (cytosine1402-N4)-methyltransferase